MQKIFGCKKILNVHYEKIEWVYTEVLSVVSEDTSSENFYFMRYLDFL